MAPEGNPRQAEGEPAPEGADHGREIAQHVPAPRDRVALNAGPTGPTPAHQVTCSATPRERLVEGGVVQQREEVVHLQTSHAVGEDRVLRNRLAEISFERAHPLPDEA